MSTKNRERRIKKCVRKLRNLEDNCLKTRGRYWADRFLSRLYKFYANWKKNRVGAARRQDLIRYSVRSDKTLLHVMFDCMSRANPKTRNRWTRALLMADAKGIPPEELQNFLRGNKGGIAGVADEYAAHRRTQKEKRGQGKTAGSGTKGSLKLVASTSDADEDDEWD